MFWILPTHNFADFSSQVIMLLHTSVTLRMDSPQPDLELALNHHHRVAIPQDISVQRISMTPVSRGDDTPVLNLQLTSAFNLLCFLSFFQKTGGFPGRKVVKLVS